MTNIERASAFLRGQIRKLYKKYPQYTFRYSRQHCSNMHCIVALPYEDAWFDKDFQRDYDDLEERFESKFEGQEVVLFEHEYSLAALEEPDFELPNPKTKSAQKLVVEYNYG